MKVIIILFLVAISLNTLQARPKHYELENYSFEQFIVDFQKNYSSSEEYEYRRALFNQKLIQIEQHNSNPNNKWKKGVNEHSDMTHMEFKQHRLLTKSKQQSQFMKINDVQQEQLQQVKQKSEKKLLPDSVDWTKNMNPIRNQGNCGSCWAFATTAMIEGHFNIYNSNLKKIVLSPQHLVDCVPNPNECGGTGGCNGATAEIAMDYLKTSGGQTSEKMYPYRARDGYCFWDKNSEPPQVQIEDYVRLKENDHDELMDAVANKGPISISVDASDWSDYEIGIFDGCDYKQNMDVNHAVVLVGYGSENGEDYWLVRNSWGTYYGEDGYIRVKREKETICGVDKTPWDGSACKGDKKPRTVCGMCGILSESSYPTGVKPAAKNLIM